MDRWWVDEVEGWRDGGDAEGGGYTNVMKGRVWMGVVMDKNQEIHDATGCAEAVVKHGRGHRHRQIHNQEVLRRTHDRT